MDAQPNLTIFDYVTDDALRANLVSDFTELQSALASGSWKCAQVIAGSVIEAVLVDYLDNAGFSPSANGKQLTELDLGTLIQECVKRGILAKRLESMCAVIKNFRNLIHPGRVVRLHEPASKNDAEISARLVDMIIEGIRTKRKEEYGYTAIEVVDKIRKDPQGFGTVLPSLLSDLKRAERTNLLFRLLPEWNHQWRTSLATGGHESFEHPELVQKIASVELCFRELVRTSDGDTKKKLAERYLRVLEQGTTTQRLYYEAAFVRAADLADYHNDKREIVIDHLLAKLHPMVEGALPCTEGIGKFLVANDKLSSRLDLMLALITNAQEETWSDVLNWMIVFSYDILANDVIETEVQKKLSAIRNLRYTRQGRNGTHQRRIADVAAYFGLALQSEIDANDGPGEIPF